MRLELFDDPGFLGHVAVALRAHREAMRKGHHPCPPGLAELEDFCAGRLRKVQGGSTLANTVTAVHAAAMKPNLLYTLPEAAGALAVSEATTKRLIAARDLPAVKVGARTLIRRCDLEQYVDGLSEAN